VKIGLEAAAASRAEVVPGVEADAYELYERGRALLADRHAHQAATVLERAQALVPDRGSVCEALGRAYYASGRFAAAKDQFAKAVDLDPANDYGHFGLALCLLKLGERSLALGHLRLALAMRPESDPYRLALDRAAAGTSSGDGAPGGGAPGGGEPGTDGRGRAGGQQGQGPGAT
jgi:tetratricopeptide (TPR) repeat protein